MNDTTPQPGAAYAGASAAVLGAAEDIGVYLALWSMREDGGPCPDARRAANSAMDAIDNAVRDLYALRSRLVGDVRDYDDATAARVDAMLAEREPVPDSAAGGEMKQAHETAGVTPTEKRLR